MSELTDQQRIHNLERDLRVLQETVRQLQITQSNTDERLRKTNDDLTTYKQFVRSNFQRFASITVQLKRKDIITDHIIIQ